MQWPVAVTKEAYREGEGHVINIWCESTGAMHCIVGKIRRAEYLFGMHQKLCVFTADSGEEYTIFGISQTNIWHFLSLSELYLLGGSTNVHWTPLFHFLYIQALITSWLQRSSFSHLNIMQLINICFLLIHCTSLHCRLQNCNISTIKELVNKMVIMFAHS